MAAFNTMSKEVCLTALNPSRGTLDALSAFVTNNNRTRILPLSNKFICGDHQFNCANAFSVIAREFPKCLDKLIKASVFKGPNNDL